MLIIPYKLQEKCVFSTAGNDTGFKDRQFIVRDTYL